MSKKQHLQFVKGVVRIKKENYNPTLNRKNFISLTKDNLKTLAEWIKGKPNLDEFKKFLIEDKNPYKYPPGSFSKPFE
jgi:hypothetical protein